MQIPNKDKFKLTENFIEDYKTKKPPFGFNGLGELVFIRTYSRIKEDGKNEAWWETIRRVVEGIYNIQKEHIDHGNLGWNAMKAQKSAQEMYDLMFNIKFLPSGRALWSMGSSLITEKRLVESLYNCGFISTNNLKESVSYPFEYAMDMLMCGVGIGFDTRGAGTVTIRNRSEEQEVFVIPDSREGWVEATKKVILSFFGQPTPILDYSIIRPEGSPIKTFGGTSSGYKPLKELHDNIISTLSTKTNLKITQRDIVDIFNFIAKAVVAGNVRRSAEIALGNNDEEFLNLKNYKVNPDREAFGWASNNSVLADLGMSYKDIASRIRDNAEPGVIWIENFRQYGRMRELEANNVDFRITGVNPCFTADTLILTEEGYEQIGTIAAFEKYNLVTAEGNVVEGKARGTGTKKVYILNLSTNKKIKCTADHIFMNVYGEEVKAIDSKGVQLKPYLKYPELDSHYTLFGFIQGDGDLGRLKSDKHLGVEVNIGEKDQDILKLLEGHKYTSGQRKVYLQDIKEELLKEKFDSRKLPEREFPYEYANWNQYQRASFLRGCFSANGTINNFGRVCYKATSKRFIEQLQGNLEVQFGISSFITTNKSHPIKFSNGTYVVKESYDLNISDFESKTIFFNKINFYQQYKIEKLEKLLNEMAPFVKSVKYLGEQEVFDFSLPEYHWGVIEGVVAHNCAEIGMESSELCNLSEVFPFRINSKEEFIRTLKYAYLFAKSVTLIETHWVETNRVMLRNRRLGISVTGISQFIAERGTNELKDWLKTGYETVKNYDNIYSDWFAIPRSIKLTTVKPSGTVSLLGGATPGVHYPESTYYIRRVRLGNNSPLVEVLKNAGYHIELAFGQEDSTSVIEFPIFIGESVRTQEDVSMWEQLAQAAFMQKYWSDNAVSVTVTFDPEKEGKDIERALDFYQYQLKGVSFLPKLETGAYAQMPYEKITKERYEEMVSKLKEIDFSSMTGSSIAEIEKYCNNDGCSF
jgi:ribonucleotide reductase alpha subunit